MRTRIGMFVPMLLLSAVAETQGQVRDEPSVSVDPVLAEKRARIKDSKELRVEIERLKERMQKSPIKSPERTLAYRALQQAKHWLGEDLQACGTENPYPNSTNPTNTIVDPPADMPAGETAVR